MAAGKPANMRILIAEDDTALAGFVRKGLEAEHYAVDVSSDGEQARALATELDRSEEHTSELQSHVNLVCRLLLEKKKKRRPSREGISYSCIDLSIVPSYS